ncbi:Aste57867_14380 [Aphanomyces stellatus]|uniref:Aste57867_14380 protein n=1 Tax=Aphanomyces stellatus TaxID=120398 RepID=A0A485L1B3_9STRA|nr:hypothetical protein As57867_014326 [Aphanomyces stellatus]VFT91203.1 Aste57867_14380 [Aphanomyces stellatus]
MLSHASALEEADDMKEDNVVHTIKRRPSKQDAGDASEPSSTATPTHGLPTHHPAAEATESPCDPVQSNPKGGNFAVGKHVLPALQKRPSKQDVGDPSVRVTKRDCDLMGIAQESLATTSQVPKPHSLEGDGYIRKSTSHFHRPDFAAGKIVPIIDRISRQSAGFVASIDEAVEMRMRKNKQTLRSKKYKLEKHRRKSKRQKLLHPNSQFRAGWDIYMIVLLIYTSIMTPYEIAFVEQVTLDGLFVTDRAVDLSFLLDMVFNFLTPFMEKDSNQLIDDIGQISAIYLKSWFVLDFISIIPLDVISLIADPTTDPSTTDPTAPKSTSVTQHLKIIRIIRLFRLIKLVRVLRASRIYSRWEAVLGFKYTTVKLAKFLSGVLILAHWLACLWGLTPNLESPEDLTWMEAYRINQTTSTEKYIVSLYWSVMTIGTVGYGDVQPKNDLERCICIGCMLLGGGTYAYIIGAVCGLVASMDEAETEFNQQMDHLNVYMNKENVPRDMKIKLREYFLHSRDLLQHKYFSYVISTLSPGLRGLISVYTNGEWANNIHFFNGGPYDEHVRFVTAVTQQLKAELYPPNENVIDVGDTTDKMYIISKGIVARQGRVMGKGRFFGEDVILSHGIRKYTVRTLTYVDAYSLSRIDLDCVLSNGMFPFKTKKIRVAASFLALKRLLQSLMLELRTIRRDKGDEFSKAHETLWLRHNLLGDTVSVQMQVTMHLTQTIEQLKEAVRQCDIALAEAAVARDVVVTSEDGTKEISVIAAHKRTSSVRASKVLLEQALTLLHEMAKARTPPPSKRDKVVTSLSSPPMISTGPFRARRKHDAMRFMFMASWMSVGDDDVANTIRASSRNCQKSDRSKRRLDKMSDGRSLSTPQKHLRGDGDDQATVNKMREPWETTSTDGVLHRPLYGDGKPNDKTSLPPIVARRTSSIVLERRVPLGTPADPTTQTDVETSQGEQRRNEVTSKVPIPLLGTALADMSSFVLSEDDHVIREVTSSPPPLLPTTPMTITTNSEATQVATSEESSRLDYGASPTTPQTVTPVVVVGSEDAEGNTMPSTTHKSASSSSFFRRSDGVSSKILPIVEHEHHTLGHASTATDDAASSTSSEMRMRKNKQQRLRSKKYQLDQLRGLSKRQIHLHPNSTFRGGWDLFMIVLLVYTSVMTPYEIAFVDVVTVDNLFIADRVVDVSFFVDMILNFLTPYIDKETNQLMDEISHITFKYIQGWFLLDFVSIIPFDVISLATEDPVVDATPSATSAKRTVTQKLKIIRIIRLFRLVKLVRVLRASRIYSRWEAILGSVQLAHRLPRHHHRRPRSFKYTTVKLAKFLSGVLILAHWLACLWGLTPNLESPDDFTWMDAYKVNQSSSLDKYIVSLYWSVMTIGTVGYGDVQPKTDFERCVCIGCMLCGGGTYAYIIGAVCGLVASMDEAQTEFNQQMDHLNVYMNKEKVPRDMKIKLREYFLHSRDLLQHKYFSYVISTLSPGLRGLISVYTNGEWANNIHFFHGGPVDEHVRFVTAITQQLKAELYPPNENIIDVGDTTDKMYILSKGIVARLGRVLGKGRFFGEDVILSHGIRKYTVRTLTFVDAYSLSRVDLEGVLSNGMFPFKTKKIRVAAAFLALKRLLQSLMLELRTLRRDQGNALSKAHETLWLRSHLLGDARRTFSQVQTHLAHAIAQLTEAVAHCQMSLDEAAQAKAAADAGSDKSKKLLATVHKRLDSVAMSKHLLEQTIGLLQTLIRSRVPPPDVLDTLTPRKVADKTTTSQRD